MYIESEEKPDSNFLYAFTYLANKADSDSDFSAFNYSFILSARNSIQISKCSKSFWNFTLQPLLQVKVGQNVQNEP